MCEVEVIIIMSVCFVFQMECQFEQALKSTTGLIIKKMRPDGACLFRAVGELHCSVVVLKKLPVQ